VKHNSVSTPLAHRGNYTPMFIILHLRRLSEAQGKPNELRHNLLIPVQGIWNTDISHTRGNSAHWQHFAALGHDKKLLSTVTSNHRMVSTQTREPNSFGQSPTTAATARDHQVKHGGELITHHSSIWKYGTKHITDQCLKLHSTECQ